jgi:cytoskeletal protein CcmA (bactofilin family)
VFAVAPTVTVSGEVGEALRASANTLELTGAVGTDLVGAALSADLGPGSEVQGDVLIWALTVRAAGDIGANLEGSQRTLEIEGLVGGDIDVSVGTLVVTGSLEVGGDLGYRSERDADGLDQASVGGVVAHKTPLPPNVRVRALGLLARFLVVLGLTTAAVLVAWGWPKRTRRGGELVRRQILRVWGMGALVMVSPLLLGGLAGLLVGLAPDAASLPLLAIFAPLVLATAGVVLVLSLVAGVPAVLAFGDILPGRFGLHGTILVGSLAAGLIWLVPLVGWLVPIVMLPVGLGAWIHSFRAEPEPEPS